MTVYKVLLYFGNIKCPTLSHHSLPLALTLPTPALSYVLVPAFSLGQCVTQSSHHSLPPSPPPFAPRCSMSQLPVPAPIELAISAGPLTSSRPRTAHFPSLHPCPGIKDATRLQWSRGEQMTLLLGDPNSSYCRRVSHPSFPAYEPGWSQERLAQTLVQGARRPLHFHLNPSSLCSNPELPWMQGSIQDGSAHGRPLLP